MPQQDENRMLEFCESLMIMSGKKGENLGISIPIHSPEKNQSISVFLQSNKRECPDKYPIKNDIII